MLVLSMLSVRWAVKQHAIAYDCRHAEERWALDFRDGTAIAALLGGSLIPTRCRKADAVAHALVDVVASQGDANLDCAE
eukprot:14707866-Alexandrium_andersonii.AAC.1